MHWSFRNLALVCAVSTVVAAAVATGCGPSADEDDEPSADSGALIGRVQALSGDNNVGSAEITVGDTNVRANEQGWFTIPQVDLGDRRRVTVEADGFVSTQRIVDVEPGRTFVDVRLKSRAPFQQINASQSQSLEFSSGAELDLPANALMTQNGQPFSGSAQVSVTDLDPSADNATLATPGDFTALPGEANENSQLETFGMAELAVRSQSGDPLRIADDAEATIAVPVPDSISSGDIPDSMPLWRYDEQQGRWVQDNGTVTYDSETNTFRGSVSGADSSSFWNADRLFESACLTGQIVKPESGETSAGIAVRAEGIDYVGSSTARTDSNGEFRIQVQRSTENDEVGVELQAQGGGFYLDDPVVVDPTPTAPADSGNCRDLGTIELNYPLGRIALSWGENPSDLDTHLTGPLAGDSGRFHLYYSNMNIGDQALLDTDDTSSYGPEVTSILRKVPGEYVYSVKNYSGESAHPIADSGAMVQAFIGNEVRTFTISDATDQTTDSASNPVWRVFQFEISQNGSVSDFQTIDTIVNDTGNVFGPDYTGGP